MSPIERQLLPLSIALLLICIIAPDAYAQQQIRSFRAEPRAMVPAQLVVQDEVVQDEVVAEEAAPQEDAPTATGQPDDETAEGEVEVIDNTAEVNPREVRLHMWDGSVITGELDVANITVTTEFGQLTVPIESIVSFRPGLNSFPNRKQQIDALVEQLGSSDFKTREAAKRDLVAMGTMLHKHIYTYSDDNNAERKRHLEEIRKEFEQQIDDFEDVFFEGEDNQVPLIDGDSVQTNQFVIVGKIDQEGFSVNSKYGKLIVQLSDVRLVDREQVGTLVRRTNVTVQGKSFIHSSPKSTGLRVNRGDRIQISASGQMTMSPWGNQAAVQPDGNSSYGNFHGHGGGTLLAVIGDSSEYIKVGSRASFIAPSSGVLKLGIAIQMDYANPNYDFPGEYKAKITIEGQAE